MSNITDEAFALWDEIESLRKEAGEAWTKYSFVRTKLFNAERRAHELWQRDMAERMRPAPSASAGGR